MTEKTDDAIFGFAYEMAMRDATMRNAFRGATIYALLGKRNPNTKLDATRAQKENAERAKGAVAEYIDGIFSDQGYKTQGQHDEAWDLAVNEAITAFGDYNENGSSFTYGNAQKLVNMAAKYLFIATYRNRERGERFVYCHCPMDSIMLDKVAKAAEASEGAAARQFIEECTRTVKHRDGTTERVVRDDLKWSSVLSGDKRYDYYQRAVRELADPMLPIEYDFAVWGK